MLSDALAREFARDTYRVADGPVPPAAELAAAKAALVAASPFRGEIYLPTEKIPLADQVRGLRRVAQLTTEDNLEVSRRRFEALRRLLHERGIRRVFVIGNGPSLKMTDLALLKDEVTIAFNGIFLHESFTPTIYVVEDHLVAEDRQREIHDYRCPVKMFPSYLGYCIAPQENTIFLNHRPRISYPVDTDFSAEAGRMSYTGGTVTYTGLQIAASLGAEEIVLIGVDASYRVHNVDRSDQYGTGVLTSKEDDVNHFDPRYFGKGYRWHDPNVHTMLQAYRKAREFGRDHGVRIVNASLGGQLEVFERVDYHQLFERQRVHPGLAVLDFTSVHRLSATGVIKKNLLEGWPKSAQFHVFADEQARLVAFQNTTHDLYAPGSDDNSVWPAFRSLVEYDPGVLYLRPTLDRVPMTVLQVVAAAVLGKPWVVHYMDDWLAKAVVVRGPAVAAAYREVMDFLFGGADHVLSISAKMSRHLIEELGVEAGRVVTIHNYMPSQVMSRKPGSTRDNDVRVIRYFGGLEPDMGLATVLEVARQISELNEGPAGPRWRLEIVTSPHQIKLRSEAFASVMGTSLIPQYEDYGDYLAALSTSDLNLICYNFDERSLDYVRYSLANKLPELLASGVPFLAIGHPEVATIELLRELKYPLVLDHAHFEIGSMLELALAPGPEQLQALQAGQAALKNEFSEANHRCRFHALLRESACRRPPPARPPSAALQTLLDSVSGALRHSQDLEILMRLPLLPPDVLGPALARIRAHGRTWSVRNEFVALGKSLKNPADLLAAGTDFQSRALAFLVSSLGHERYLSVNTVVRSWLQEIDLDAVRHPGSTVDPVGIPPMPDGARRDEAPGMWCTAPVVQSGANSPTHMSRAEFMLSGAGTSREAVVLLDIRSAESAGSGLRVRVRVRVRQDGAEDVSATSLDTLVNEPPGALCVRHVVRGLGDRLRLELEAVDPAGPRFVVNASYLVTLERPDGPVSAGEVPTLPLANRWFRDRSYARALQAYLALHACHGHSHYVSNALRCAGKLTIE